MSKEVHELVEQNNELVNQNRRILEALNQLIPHDPSVTFIGTLPTKILERLIILSNSISTPFKKVLDFLMLNEPTSVRIFGQLIATTQLHSYGGANFSKIGYEKNKILYEKPDILESGLNLRCKVYMVTGANTRTGREITKFLAANGARVFMCCRNAKRAESMRREIIDATKNENLFILLGDLRR